MRQPLLTLRGYLDVLLVDGAARMARHPGRALASALGALPVAVLLLAAAIGLRATEDAGPVRDAALTAPATGGVAASAAVVRPIQAEIGQLEYLPGERPTFAMAARGGAGPLEYLPGEAPAGMGEVAAPLFGRLP